MSDRDALFAAICAAPADDTARLVFADWLDEHGEHDRAAVARAEVELRRAAESGTFAPPDVLPREGGDRIDWSAVAPPEAAALFAAHHTVLAAKPQPLPVPEALQGAKGFRLLPGPAGWPTGVYVTDAAAFARRATDVFRAGPVTRLVVDRLTPEATAALVGCGAFEHIRELELGPRADVSGLAALGRNPAAAAIRSLGVMFPANSIETAQALTAGPHWTGLRHLALGNPNYPQAPSNTLAEMLRRPHLRGLRSLGLQRIGGGADVSIALANGACPELRYLAMQQSYLAGGATALVHSRKLTALRALDLTGGWVSANEVAQLIITPSLPNLTALAVRIGKDNRPAAPAFRGPNRAPTLRFLDLSNGHLNADRVAALAGCPALAGLWVLHLRGCRITTPTLKALAAATWPELTALDLSQNKLSAKSTAVLAGWPGAPRLQWLDLRNNPLRTDVPRGKPKKWKAVAELAETDRLPNLKFLAVSRPDTDETHARLLAGRYGDIVHRTAK